MSACCLCGAENAEFCIADSGDWEAGTTRASVCRACTDKWCPAAGIAVDTEAADIASIRYFWKAKWAEERDAMIHKHRAPRRNLKQAVGKLIDSGIE